MGEAEKVKVMTLERRVGQLENEELRQQKLTEENLNKQIYQLKLHNLEMKRELNCFDSEFFEELEDMKYELEKSKELNLEYEKVIQKLCEKFKLSYKSLTNSL